MWKGDIALWFILMIIVFSYSQVPVIAQQKPTIIVLANSIDYDLASDFFGFLGNKGIEKIRITADDFTQYQDSKFLIVLGGPDAYEGVGEIVQQVLTPEEQDYLRTRGNRKMYVKTNIWTNGQVVTVIAGSDRQMTQKAHQNNQDNLVVLDSDNDRTVDLLDDTPLLSLTQQDVFDEKTLNFLEQLETLDTELDGASTKARIDLLSFWNGTLTDTSTIQTKFNTHKASFQDVYKEINKLVPPEELKPTFQEYINFIRQRIEAFDKLNNDVIRQNEYNDFAQESMTLRGIWNIGDNHLNNAQKKIKELFESNGLIPPDELIDRISPEPMPITPIYPDSSEGLVVEEETLLYPGLGTVITNVKVSNSGPKSYSNVEVECIPYSYGGQSIGETHGYNTLGSLSPKSFKSVGVVNDYSVLINGVFCFATGYS